MVTVPFLTKNGLSKNFKNCSRSEYFEICADLYTKDISKNNIKEYGLAIYPIRDKIRIDSLLLDRHKINIECMEDYPHFGSYDKGFIKKGIEFYLTSDAFNYKCVYNSDSINLIKTIPKIFCLFYRSDKNENKDCVPLKIKH